jgi:hypothetical protein
MIGERDLLRRRRRSVLDSQLKIEDLMLHTWDGGVLRDSCIDQELIERFWVIT